MTKWTEKISWRHIGTMLVAAVVWVVAELAGAFRKGKERTVDTWTQISRPFINAHPVIWWSTLGGTVGFVAWLIRHLWFGEK